MEQDRLAAERSNGLMICNAPPLAEDILRGAEAIAEFVFGDADMRRIVYHLTDKGNLPHFKLGTIICARRSTLLAWIEEQEAASAARRAAR